MTLPEAQQQLDKAAEALNAARLKVIDIDNEIAFWKEKLESAKEALYHAEYVWNDAYWRLRKLGGESVEAQKAEVVK